jgi:hypothetical protein
MTMDHEAAKQELLKHLNDHPEKIDAAITFLVSISTIEKIRAGIAQGPGEAWRRSREQHGLNHVAAQGDAKQEPIPELRPSRPRRT